MRYTITGRVVGTERATNSVNGNPGYFVTIETPAGDILRFRTAPDSSLSYTMNNPEHRAELHTFYVSKSGRLMFARPVL